MIKYRTCHGTIVEFEVEKADAVTISLSVRGHIKRERRQSKEVNWHDTWEKAHEFLVDKANKDVRDANANLRAANRRLVRLCGLTNNYHVNKPKEE
jgi:hypothetical protein